MEPNYYGTDDIESGHYFRHISKDGFDWKRSVRLNLSFYPEDYIIKDGKYLPLGSVIFDYRDDYTICVIIGSAVDRRPGSISMFFFKGLVDRDIVIADIKNNPVMMNLINKMPFKVEIFKP